MSTRRISLLVLALLPGVHPVGAQRGAARIGAYTPRAIAVATRSLTDGDPLFAVAAARRLGAIGGEPGRASLQAALATERRVTVRAALTAAVAAR